MSCHSLPQKTKDNVTIMEVSGRDLALTWSQQEELHWVFEISVTVRPTSVVGPRTHVLEHAVPPGKLLGGAHLFSISPGDPNGLLSSATPWIVVEPNSAWYPDCWSLGKSQVTPTPQGGCYPARVRAGGVKRLLLSVRACVCASVCESVRLSVRDKTAL